MAAASSRGALRCVRSLIGQPVVQIFAGTHWERANSWILADLDIWIRNSWKKFRAERKCGCHEFAKIQYKNRTTVHPNDRPCLVFVISNVLRIGSQSILRLIARLNPPRSRQRPFIEYLYTINNSSTEELVANYVNGLDRRISSSGVYLRTWNLPYKHGFIRYNQSAIFARNYWNI